MVGAYLVVVVALLLCAAYIISRPGSMQMVRSPITGREYSVRRAPDSQQVADRLALLEQRLNRLLDGANGMMPNDPRIATIRRRWDGTLSEVEAVDEVAFSVDKTSIHVCVRGPDGTIQDLNASMFVLLHELAHVATSDFGHSQAFWANMRFLLELAEHLGIYKYETHGSATFCGHPLGASPLTCVKHGSCESTLRTPLGT